MTKQRGTCPLQIFQFFLLNTVVMVSQFLQSNIMWPGDFDVVLLPYLVTNRRNIWIPAYSFPSP
jgi:hypothetical protein